MPEPKKLIEVAMPIKEISSESARDKSIRHGHISTLHVWWARRPLPVCRAVIFASLIPDPLDENCPAIFQDAVNIILSKKVDDDDPYKPYQRIPYVSLPETLKDDPRNRLLMFIGKFSDKYLISGENTSAKEKLSNFSLIKWDNRNNDQILTKARKLIWVANNASQNISAEASILEYCEYFGRIQKAEEALYSFENRHIITDGIKFLQDELNTAIEAFLLKMPKVFDPFAGGGAIPLEVARLGCRSFGNDINPVAHIIQKGSLEYPQLFGKPIIYSKEEFIKLYGIEEWNLQPGLLKKTFDGISVAVTIPNRLSHDVEFYAKKILIETEKEIGLFYPNNIDGKKTIAYYWAYNGTCLNPSCRAKIPLIKSFYLVDKPNRKVHLKPVITEKVISFEICDGEYKGTNWIQSKNLKCPICGNITGIKELKRQFNAKEPTKNILAVILDGVKTKHYRLPTTFEIEIVNTLPANINRPIGKMPIGNNRDLHCMGWGVEDWADMFTNRQLLLINTLVKKLEEFKRNYYQSTEYHKAILVYLSIFIDRIAIANTAFGRWHVSGEKLETPFSRQAIPFMLDFPESNPFSGATGSATNQLEWIVRYIDAESHCQFSTQLKNATSGDETQFDGKYLDAVITDPPYYDAIAYADLSDFFYIWLKDMLGDVFFENFAVPQTPKTEECTALKHHHNGNMEEAKHHFEQKLGKIFSAIEKQTKDVVSIMFAHQSTEAWSTLCNSILSSKMNITGSWAIDTEMGTRMVAMENAALKSSVTVSCRPTLREGLGEYKVVKLAIEKRVAKEVEELYELGFRGADLITACFGQAVSEFGQYEKVEKADGSEIKVAELLEMARESALNALLKGFSGDEFTKFYIGWLQIYGFEEMDFDNAAKFSRIVLRINVQELFNAHILIKNGNKQILGGYSERTSINNKLGEQTKSILIDRVHKGMFLYKKGKRQQLLELVNEESLKEGDGFWRVIASLCEILNPGDEYDQANGLQTNKESLIRDSKVAVREKTEQTRLEF